MSQREELGGRIREKRLAEATKKGLTGQTGKIGTVLRTMGSPITAQSADASLLDLEGRGEDDYQNPIDSIPVMDIPGAERPQGSEWSETSRDPDSFSTHDVGWHFDGLGRGMHMEIVYKNESSEMSVYHRGYLVYRETQGELECYVPSEEWEGWISSLFSVAKKVQREEKEEEFQRKVQRAEQEKRSWLRDLAARWGIT